MNAYSVYSASEGPKMPQFYIRAQPPEFPVRQTAPPQLTVNPNTYVSYAPVQQPVFYSTLIPTQTTISIPQTDSYFIPTTTLPPEKVIYSSLQNISPTIDESDSLKKNKDFDFNTHYELDFKKEMNIFPYAGIRKKNIPLFGHLELPQEYNYTSPLLSPDMRYLACLARGADDIVFVWDTNNLDCFKYKYTSLRVDGLAFTPNSECIIIVYRFNSPVMYNLENGESIRTFEKNGEESNRVGFQYSFSKEGKHFGYLSDQSFTIWSTDTGLQKKKIKNKAPIKMICGEYLICISDDLICSFIKCSDGITDLQFKIRGVASVKEILDCRVSLDMKYFYYVIEQGIIKYHIETQEFQGLQKFKPTKGKIKAVISPDCRYVVKTNMKHLNLYNLETQDTIGTIIKDPFYEFRIDFGNKKILTINDICINIHDYSKENLPEKFVWLNKNPTHFVDIKFSKDFKILIGKIDNNDSVVYDCETGKIIRKFKNYEKDYSISCEVAPTKTANLTNIVSKSGNRSISVFNYMNGREDTTFYGFDAYSFCFSDDGSLIAVGAKNGPECARLYNVNSGQYVTFSYSGNNYNFHTVVNITSPKPEKLICCSIDQQPLIFNIQGELIFKCKCPYRFEEIYQIESDLKYNVFLVKGRDTQKRNIALLYRLSDGILMEKYENYSSMNLALNNGYLVGKCENIRKNKLTTMNLHNIIRPVRKACQLQADDFYFLNDYKGFVCKFGGDENSIYYIGNVDNGRLIAKINYAKKSNRNAETHISVDPTRNEMVFRYIEIVPFDDTLLYRNQHIDKINGEETENENIDFSKNNNNYDNNENMEMSNNGEQLSNNNEDQFNQKENEGF